MTETKIIILDNYDSFSYNLFQFLGELTKKAPLVYRNDKVSLSEIINQKPTHIVISPGPGNPENPAYFGVCNEVILKLEKTPILGVCLGHQGIGAAFGGHVVRAPKVMHGKTSQVFHDGTGLFQGIDSPCTVMRYHSLIIDPATLPACLRVNAKTEDGIIMGVEHRSRPIFGIQFHPESIGTEPGMLILENFIKV